MVISVLVVVLVYSSFTPFIVFAVPPDPNRGGTCAAPTSAANVDKQTCCWKERVAGKLPPNNEVRYCQTCYTYPEGAGSSNCDPKQQQLRPSSGGVSPLEEGVLEQTPTPPSGPAAPLQGGVLEQPPTPPSGPAAPLQDGGVLQQPPADEGTGAAPRTVEPPSTADEATPCPEGQVLDEETNLCVLEEQEEAAEEPTTEEDQPSEESDSGEDSNN